MYKHNFNHHHHPQNCNKFSLIYSPLHICSIVEILSPKSVHPLVNGVFIYLLNRCIFDSYNPVSGPSYILSIYIVYYIVFIDQRVFSERYDKELSI